MSDSSSSPFTLREFGVRTLDGFETSPLNAELKAGQTLLIVGSASSGKSIIFEALAGIVRPQVMALGQAQGRAALVPQDSRLSALPTDNVWSILDLGRRAFILRKLFGFNSRYGTQGNGTQEKRATELLARLGVPLDRVFDRPLSTLSTGERKRLLCVAALLGKPTTLLIDGWEEFADPVMRRSLVGLLREECEKGMMLVVNARHFPPLDLVYDRALQLEGPERDTTLSIPLVPSIPAWNDGPLPLLAVTSLVLERRRRGGLRRTVSAYPVDGANLGVFSGETLCVLGPSACGKTSLLQAIAGLVPSSHGEIRVNDRDVTQARGRRARRLRRDVQLVFQDAAAALDPDRSVRNHLQEAANIGAVKSPDLGAYLEKFGLKPSLLDAAADRLSESESQRLDLARSLILAPQLVLWDAPEVSAADTDGGVLASALKREKSAGRAFLIATQSPQVVEALADRVAIMHAGRIIEIGTRAEVMNRPAHPLTVAYLSGLGVPPSDPCSPSAGCSFVSHCPRRQVPICADQEPKLTDLVRATDTPQGVHSRRHRVACFFPIGEVRTSAMAHATTAYTEPGRESEETPS